MSAPAILIPIDATWTAELAARRALAGSAWWKLEIDDDGDGSFTDYTSKLRNNTLSISASQGIFQAAEAAEASFQLRNFPKIFSAGAMGNAKIRISAKIGSAGYIRVFTGYVDPAGASRAKGHVADDILTVTAHDPARYRGVKRRTDSESLLSFKISDPATPSSSIAHHLAAALGLSSGECEFSSIPSVKDYLPLSKDGSAWAELQDLANQYGALLAFRYDGLLRLLTWSETDWNTATPEYTFDVANVHMWQCVGGDVTCNHAVTEFEKYQVLASGVIYKNLDSWNQVYQRNAIAVAAGKYWPGGDDGSDSQAVGLLSYGRDGEAFPIGISIATPTIGADGSGSDIECSGGLLTLVSFNGSTADTSQNLDSSEIILRNNTGGTVTITKFQLRGTPLRVSSKNRVEYTDPTLSQPWEEVRKQVPGKYATSKAQAQVTVKRWVDFGKIGRREYIADVDFTPHLQCGALVRFHPTTDVDSVCVITGYSHVSQGPHTKTRTTIKLVERIAKDDTGAGTTVYQSPGAAAEGGGAEAIAARPTYTEIIQTGFTIGGGTVTPAVPTISYAEGRGRNIAIAWDHQNDLTNFDHYELQVTDDPNALTTPLAVQWYALQVNGSDWKGVANGVTQTPIELLVHTNVPLAGTVASPLARTLYYQVRRVTKAPLASAWSPAVAGAASPVETADIAAASIIVEKLDVGALNALIANINQYLQVSEDGFLGQTFTGDPYLGAQRTRVYRNGLIVETYDGAAWQVSVQLAGEELGGLYPYLQARGMVAVGGSSDDSAFGLGDSIPAGARGFGFDDVLTDQNGASVWTQTNGEYTTTKKYGTKAWRSTAGNTGTLVDADAAGTSFGASHAVDFWLDVVTQADDEVLRLETGFTHTGKAADSYSPGTSPPPLALIPPEKAVQLDRDTYVGGRANYDTSGFVHAASVVMTPYLRNTSTGAMARGSDAYFTILNLANNIFIPLDFKLCRISDTQFAVAFALRNATTGDVLLSIRKVSFDGTSFDLSTVPLTYTFTPYAAAWGSQNILSIGLLDSSTVIVAHTNPASSGGDGITIRAIDVSTWTLSGSGALVPSSGSPAGATERQAMSLVCMDGTDGVCAYNDRADSKLKLKGFSWSGGAFAFGPAIDLASSTSPSCTASLERLTNTDFVAEYAVSSVAHVYLRIGQISTTTASLLGSAADLSGENGSSGGVSLVSVLDGVPIFAAAYTSMVSPAMKAGLYAHTGSGVIATKVALFTAYSTFTQIPSVSLTRRHGSTSCNPWLFAYDGYHSGPKVYMRNDMFLYTRLRLQNRAAGKLRYLLDNWGREERNLTEDVTVATGWRHVSLNYDQAAQFFDGSVDSGDISGFDLAGDSVNPGTAALTLTSVSQHVIFDDLLNTPLGLAVSASKAHAVSGVPWSRFDFEENVDLQLRPRSARADGSPGRILRFGDLTGINGRTLSLTNAGATLTPLDGYELVECSTGASNQTVTVPSLASSKARAPILFVKTDSGAGQLIPTRAGADTFDGGATTVPLTTQWDAVLIWPGPATWHVLHINSAPTGISSSTANGFTGGRHTHAITADSITAASLAADSVGQSELANAAVGQGELKTSTGTVTSTSTGINITFANSTMPGGQYGFYPQCHVNTTASITTCEVKLLGGSTGIPTSATSVVYGSFSWSVSASHTATITQRYVTASGEVFWIFIKREKKDHGNFTMYCAPDHPCFGNGGDPGKIQLPFAFDQDLEEMLVINPTSEQVSMAHGLAKSQRIPLHEAFFSIFEIDESKEAEWCTEPVSVRMDNDWDEKYRTGAKYVGVERVAIPRPDNVICLALKDRKEMKETLAVLRDVVESQKKDVEAVKAQVAAQEAKRASAAAAKIGG